MSLATERVTRYADLLGTFVFAIEGSLAAVGSGLDPVGVTVISFVTAPGGGVIRDLLQKSLDHGIPALPAIFLGAISGAGGGTLRDVLLNQVPHVLRVDIYASAAMAAAVVVLGRRLAWPPTAAAIAAWSTCFVLRLLAVANGWQLPVAIR